MRHPRRIHPRARRPRRTRICTLQTLIAKRERAMLDALAEAIVSEMMAHAKYLWNLGEQWP